MYQKIYHGPFEVIFKTLKILDQKGGGKTEKWISLCIFEKPAAV